MLCYCKKCGRIVQCDSLHEECDYCLSRVYAVPDEYLWGKSKIFIKEDLEQQFIDEFIKSSPEFDPYLFEHRDEDLFNRRMQNRAALAHGKALLEEERRKVTCSYCGSSNVRKIDFVSRAVSAELWGLGSKKIGKQWHCNSCGSDF